MQSARYHAALRIMWSTSFAMGSGSPQEDPHPSSPQLLAFRDFPEAMKTGCCSVGRCVELTMDGRYLSRTTYPTRKRHPGPSRILPKPEHHIKNADPRPTILPKTSSLTHHLLALSLCPLTRCDPAPFRRLCSCSLGCLLFLSALTLHRFLL